MFQIFKKWPLRTYTSGPWEHTEQEWAQMSNVLLQTVQGDALSLDNDCPHILRVILYLMWTFEGHQSPLAHPTTGLSVQSLFELANSQDRSGSLTSVVQNLPYVGDMYFPCIYDAAETFTSLRNDVIALLGCEPSKQQDVMDKIQCFLGKVAHRAVADMLRMNHIAELADMWYSEDLSTQRQKKCEQVNMVLY